MEYIYGKDLADEILAKVKSDCEDFPRTPKLFVYGGTMENPYYRGIIKDAEYCGVDILNCTYIVNAGFESIDCDGAISLDPSVRVRELQDIDGDRFMPCTAEATMRLLKASGVEFDGKVVTVIGRSERVGKPIAEAVNNENGTVILCHSHTHPGVICEALKYSDVIISGVGNAGFNAHDLNPESTVVDIGFDFDGDIDVAKLVPARGGVGRVTRAVLMEHLMKAAWLRKD